jgi:amino acid adenylation domain-containing protein
LAENIPEHNGQVICLDSEWARIAEESDDNPASGVTAENLAYVIYTSGSTGRPKGVMNCHQGIVNRLLWMQDEYQLTATDRVLQKTPFSFDVSVWEFFWPLLVGSRLVVARPEGHKDSSYLIDVIVDQEITTMHFVPSMLQIFLEDRDVEKCRCLKRVICSGEALPYDLQERFFKRLDAELHNLYGPTEAAVDVTYWECRRDSEQHIVPIGYPVANTQIYILDSQLQPVPVNVPGELYIGGIQVARGYLNRPKLTAERFIPDPFASGRENARLYKTGDLARFLPGGYVEYLGRTDFQVKIRGFRIELGEIEAVLTQQPTIRECVVVAREDTPGDKRLVAYLVPEQGSTPEISELRGVLKEQLPDYMVPSAFVLMEALPLTPNGKVNRLGLPEPEGLDTQSEAVYVAPASELEQTIALIWQEVLQLEKVGVNDNFFDLGGHSLLLARVHNQLRDVLDKQIPMVELFRYPTVGSLARYLAQEQEPQSSLQESVDRAEARRTLMRKQRQRRQRSRIT